MKEDSLVSELVPPSNFLLISNIVLSISALVSCAPVVWFCGSGDFFSFISRRLFALSYFSFFSSMSFLRFLFLLFFLQVLGLC